MKFRTTIDPYCCSCHGRGEVVESVEMGDGTWINSFTCHCVEYHHDEEMKEFLAALTKVAAVSSGNRNGET